jgi:uncharacterized membrane protein
MRKLVTPVLVVLTVLYPLGVYLTLGRVPPQWIGTLLVLLAALRAVVTRQRFWWAVAGGAALLAGAAWWRDDALAVKLYPVLVNAVLLGVFAASLRYPPTVVERLARLREPDLSPAGVRYTRKVTVLWCAFFVGNGAAAAYTAVFSSDASWALYNGLIAYGLMGGLMGAEWLVRQRVQRRGAGV